MLDLLGQTWNIAMNLVLHIYMFHLPTNDPVLESEIAAWG